MTASIELDPEQIAAEVRLIGVRSEEEKRSDEFLEALEKKREHVSYAVDPALIGWQI